MEILDRPLFVVIAEGDYRYGAGPILLIVEKVGAEVAEGREVWVEVAGLEVNWNGDRIPRGTLQVRKSALEREAARGRRAPA